MQKVLATILLGLGLVGCKAQMTTELHVSDINNPASNGKIIQSLATVEIMGACEEDGAETDTLAKVDGIMYNLFKTKQERLSCEKKDDYGLESIVTYSYDVSLDTIQDAEYPKDGKGKEYPLSLIANTDNGAVALNATEVFKKRLSSRLKSNSDVKFEININFINDVKTKVKFRSPSIYVHHKGKYSPFQYAAFTINSGTFFTRLGSIGKDLLIQPKQSVLIGYLTYDKPD